MATYDDIKARVYAHAAGKYEEKTGIPRRVRVRAEIEQWDKQNAGAEAWWAHLLAAVCDGVGEVPHPAETTPLAFSETHTALPAIGGILSETKTGFPATAAAVALGFGRGGAWVLVETCGLFAAMTVDEAYRRGLQEAVWPD